MSEALRSIQDLVKHGSFAGRDSALEQAEKEKSEKEKAEAERQRQSQLAEKAIKDNQLYNSKLEQNKMSLADKLISINEKIARMREAEKQVAGPDGKKKRLISAGTADTTEAAIAQLMAGGIQALQGKTGNEPDPDMPAWQGTAFREASPIASTPANLAPYYEEAAKTSGFPANWLTAQGAQESIDFRPDVISGDYKSEAGATGLQQFMPDTIEFVKKNFNPDFNPNDPKQAIEAAAWYMKYLVNNVTGGDIMNLSEGDIIEALKAYNAGPENYRRYGPDMNFPETKKYVEKIKGRL